MRTNKEMNEDEYFMAAIGEIAQMNPLEYEDDLHGVSVEDLMDAARGIASLGTVELIQRASRANIGLSRAYAGFRRDFREVRELNKSWLRRAWAKLTGRIRRDQALATMLQASDERRKELEQEGYVSRAAGLPKALQLASAVACGALAMTLFFQTQSIPGVDQTQPGSGVDVVPKGEGTLPTQPVEVSVGEAAERIVEIKGPDELGELIESLQGQQTPISVAILEGALLQAIQEKSVAAEDREKYREMYEALTGRRAPQEEK